MQSSELKGFIGPRPNFLSYNATGIYTTISWAALLVVQMHYISTSMRHLFGSVCGGRELRVAVIFLNTSTFYPMVQTLRNRNKDLAAPVVKEKPPPLPGRSKQPKQPKKAQPKTQAIPKPTKEPEKKPESDEDSDNTSAKSSDDENSDTENEEGEGVPAPPARKRRRRGQLNMDSDSSSEEEHEETDENVVENNSGKLFLWQSLGQDLSS